MTSIKESKVLFSEDIGQEFYNCFEDKIKSKNAAALYCFSRLFNSSILSKPTLQFIERCFLTVVDSMSFLQLDFNCISKILSSSHLNIDSELEIFNAIISWLDNNKKRNMYAKRLILNIRLSLLSVPALSLISEKISFYIDDLSFVNEIISKKSKALDFKLTKTVSRYCDQNKFNLVLCGGLKSGTVARDVYIFKANDSNNVTSLPQLKEGRQWPSVVCIKDELLVFGGKDDDFRAVTSIEKYSSATKTWKVIAQMTDEREDFCACGFTSNVYVFGGCLEREAVASCAEFNPKSRAWKSVAGMKEERRHAACAAFEGKMVVCGGWNDNGTLNTVEAYDHVADAWEYMPSMTVEGRSHHRSVAVKNKLFAVGDLLVPSCEVYDSRSKKFVIIKSPPHCVTHLLYRPDSVISMGNKLAVFNSNDQTCLFYDVENDLWSEEVCEITTNVSYFVVKK